MNSEKGLLIRNLCDMSVKEKMDGAGYLVVDKCEEDGANVHLSGYVRRAQFSRSKQVHIIGHDNLAVLGLSDNKDPYGVGEYKQNCYELEEEEEDDMSEEGEEQEEVEEEEQQPQQQQGTGVYNITKVVPKGTGSYDGAWIVGDEEVEAEQVVDDEDKEVLENENKMEEVDEDANETEGLTDEERLTKEFEQYNAFPDKYRVKRGECAKEKFKGYRGLRSLRQTEWDCDEELPDAYKDLVQFDNFKRMNEYYGEVTDGIEEGKYITVTVSGEELNKMGFNKTNIINSIILSLREYEHEASVIHVLFTAEPDSLPLKSGSEFLIQIGERRYTRSVVFTESGILGGKYKITKYVAPGASTLGSFYGFVTYAPSPVLLFQVIDGRQELVATGSLDGVDPARVLIERVLLTGTPIKINKHKVTVRGLFSIPSDAKWFKPIELYTKQGVCGTILCSLGEKGLVKCTFEQQLKANDVITMALYKRVFPLPPAQTGN